jgi:hypothetical protein
MKKTTQKALLNNKHNEQGLVSIITVTLIVIILALMTAGFAKIMDRELRQSLDRELAVQANYAAEAGLNDARNYIANTANPDTSGSCLDTDTLTPATAPYFAPKGSVSTGLGELVEYTCVNIDTNPKEIVYDIPAGTSRIVKVVNSPDILNDLYFSWNNSGADASTGSKTLSAAPGPYPSESFWNAGGGNEQATGVLRATIYTVPGDGSASNIAIDKNDLLESLAKNYFMYPNAGAGVGATNLANNGVNVPGNCNQNNFTNSPLPFKQSKRFCNSVVKNLAPAPPLPPAPAPKPTFVNVIGRAEGNIAYRPFTINITVGSGPTAVTASRTFTPSTFTSPLAKGYCDPSVNGGERFQNFNIPIPLPGTFTGAADTSIDYVGIDDYLTGQGDNNVSVDQLKVTYSDGTVNTSSPTSDTAWGTTGVPTLLCWIGTATFRDFSPPSAPVPTPVFANAFYYVKLTALYKDLTVSLQGTNAAGNSVSFKKAQAVVDVTAKGNDVLKRLQSRVGLDPNFNYPSYAVQSMDTLCKKLRLPVGPGGATDYQNAVYDDTTNGDPFAISACSAGGVLAP